MKLLLPLLILMTSYNASADYFKGAIGYSLSGEVKAGGTSAADLDSGFLFPIVAAYGIELYDQFYLELEFSHRNNEYKNSTEEASVTALAINGAGSIPMGAVNLTGGLGLNYGFYDLGGTTDSGNALGLQVFAGFEVPVQDTARLGLEIRHFTSITDIDVGGGVDADYQQTALLFTAKFGW